MDIKSTLKFMTAVRLSEMEALLDGYADGLSAMGCEEIIADIKRAQEVACCSGKQVVH